jgi:pyruvate/2-oxoglutarate/acetoin dehydrogenase E1 component
MKYQEAVKQSMEMLAGNENTIFIGYNINFGSKAWDTLKDISNDQKIESPVAENLMMGLAMGMSLEGFIPIVFFERHDFMLIALDAIVNHLCKIESMSQGQFKLPLIIRCVIGGKKPLNAGPQHTQDFTEVFKLLMNFPIYEPKTASEVLEAYKKAENTLGPVMIIEQKDLYNYEE